MAARGFSASLVVFSPLPPAHNGIADYTYELLPYLASEFQSIAVVIDNYAPETGRLPRGCTTVRMAQYEAFRSKYRGVPHLFQLGNNTGHTYILPLLLSTPGVVVLHDATLHHLVHSLSMQAGSSRLYRDALALEYGGFGQILAQHTERYGWTEKSTHYELPFNRTIIERAKSIIVHSHFARQKVLAQVPDKPVAVVPHHLSPRFAADGALPGRAALRKRLGVGKDELFVVSLGFISAAKKVDLILRVFARLREALPALRYALVGQRVADYDADSDVRRLGLQDIVKITDYVSEDEFLSYATAADIIINFRHPTGGETSGTLIRALGLGACVMVMDYGPCCEFPDDVVSKIAWDDNFERSFETQFLKLAATPALRAALKNNSREYVRANHQIERCAAAYIRAIRESSHLSASRQQPFAGRREYLPPAEREQALGVRPTLAARPGWLWLRQGLVPCSPETRKALVISDEDEVALQFMAFTGHSSGQVKRLTTAREMESLTRTPTGCIDLVLAQLEFTNPQALRDTLREVNRVMRLSGMLVLDLVQQSTTVTWTDWSEIDRALSYHGFQPDDSAGDAQDLSPSWDAASAGDTQHEERCWRHIKISSYVISRADIRPVVA